MDTSQTCQVENLTYDASVVEHGATPLVRRGPGRHRRCVVWPYNSGYNENIGCVSAELEDFRAVSKFFSSRRRDRDVCVEAVRRSGIAACGLEAVSILPKSQPRPRSSRTGAKTSEVLKQPLKRILVLAPGSAIDHQVANARQR